MKRTSRYFRLFFFILTFCTYLSSHDIYAQSVCPIGVGTDPKPERITLNSGKVSEAFFVYNQPWYNLDSVNSSDNMRASVTLKDIARSRIITGNNFGFRIPAGAIIKGITLMIEGRSNNYKLIDEMEVFLMDSNGKSKGQNKKNTAKGQKAWNKSVNGEDTTWMYGNANDNWGVSWTAEDINNSNFGFRLQIRSITEETLVAEIDNVSISIDYIPPYSFCNDDNLTFYIDKYENYGYYTWDFPQGFELASSSVYNQTVDLRITTASYGLHQICVDVYNYDRSYAGTCCRDILYLNCTAGAISGVVWADYNDNLLKEQNDALLKDIMLIAYSEKGQPLDTVLTGPGGIFRFESLPAGSCYIQAPAIPDSKFIIQTANSPDSRITNAYGVGTTHLIPVTYGTTVENVNIGYTPLVSIGDFVWEDMNFNGIQDNSEPGIADVKVSLYRKNGSLYSSQITDNQGKYMFIDIPANSYYLSFQALQDYQVTFSNPAFNALNSKADASGKTATFSITNGKNSDLDAGLYRSGSISGLVWEDMDGDGSNEAGNDGILQGILVEISGEDGQGISFMAQTVTDANGVYHFDGLRPGKYTIRIDNISGYLFTQNHVGNPDTDSDVISGIIDGITLYSGDNLLHLDAGMYKTGSISGRVWHDSNTNGIRTADETLMAGVGVDLYTWVNNNRILLNNTETDSSGAYIFSDLIPGKYEIEFLEADTLFYTLVHHGHPETDNDATDGLIKDIIIKSNQHLEYLDAGLYRNGFFTDFIWEDLNTDNIFSADEPYLEGVRIEWKGVTFAGDSVQQVTYTDHTGRYYLNHIQPGNYSIRIVYPTGYVLLNQMKDTWGMQSGQYISGQGIPVFRYGSISGFVWSDINENGIRDAGEPALIGTSVILTGSVNAGVVSIVMQTDSSGIYAFNNLFPGYYSLEFNAPALYKPTKKNASGDTDDSDIDADGKISGIALSSNESITGLGAGYVLKNGNSVTSYIWEDLNADGVRNTDEPMLNGVNMEIEGFSQTSVAIRNTGRSNAAGIVVFSGLPAGDYQIKVIRDSSYYFSPQHHGNSDKDSDADTNTGIIAGIHLDDDTHISDLGVGLYRKAFLSGSIWEDVNKDGIRNAFEPGIADIVVSLADINNNILATSTSDVGGNYQFDVKPGSYIITSDRLDNYILTISNQGNPEHNSDFFDDNMRYITTQLNVSSGDTLRHIDLGLITNNNFISGIVWQDTNNSKHKEPNEPILSGVPLSLFTTDSVFVQRIVTDSLGQYKFEGLTTGTYFISAPVYTDKVFVVSTDTIGGISNYIDHTYGWGTTGLLFLDGSHNLSQIDIGYARKVSIGDFVWLDANNNGLQDTGEKGIEGVEIHLISDSNVRESSTITDANGKYHLHDIPEGRYSIEFVKKAGYIFTQPNLTDDHRNSKVNPTDGRTPIMDFTSGDIYDNVDAGMIQSVQIEGMVWLDLNADGIRQSGESGQSGVKVELYSVTGVKVDEVFTAGMGSSSVKGSYVFANLIPGDYYIKFDIGSQYRISPAHKGSTDKDSDITDLYGKFTTDIISFNKGAIIKNIDAGIFMPSSIGDYVWHDVNKNGLQDVGEPGIAGVNVQLYTQNGSLIAATTTDSTGKYLFSELKQGLYYLQFGLLTGYEFTNQYAGNNRKTDSDADKAGTTPLISLAHGIDFFEVDAGMITTADFIILGRVWNDINKDGIRTPNESQKSETVVYLLNNKQVKIDSFETNHAGMYVLKSQKSGTYYIQVLRAEGLLFSPQTVGNDRDIDSDVDENGVSEALVMSAGYSIIYVDAGMFIEPTGTISGVVFLDKNKNGYRDANDTFLEDVVVFLFNEKKKFVKSIKTNALGQYTLKYIDPGYYYCMLPQFADKGFVLFTGSNMDMDSEFTNEFGQGTSRLFKIEAGVSIRHFDFGYMEIAGLDNPVIEDEIRPGTVEISVFPNPSLYYSHVQISESLIPAHLILRSVSGEIIRKEWIHNNRYILDTSDLKDGRYTVTIQSGKKRWSRSLVKTAN